jgi:hypothetical protein
LSSAAAIAGMAAIAAAPFVCGKGVLKHLAAVMARLVPAIHAFAATEERRGCPAHGRA